MFQEEEEETLVEDWKISEAREKPQKYDVIAQKFPCWCVYLTF